MASGGARGLVIGVHGGAPTTKILNLRDAHEVKKSYFTKNFNFSRCPVQPPSLK
jgi:hypothetical protein